MTKQRRDFIKIAGATATATALATTPTFARSRTKFSARLALVVSKTMPIWGTGVMRFCDNVRTMSDGDLDIRVYSAGELVPAFEVFNVVKSGRVEMGHSASYYWQGMMPASPFFCAVPFGLNAAGMRAWIKYGGGQELWDELYAPHGVMALPSGNTGLQMGGWFTKPIRDIADFKGLKMRIPGLGSKVIAKAGGQPVLVPGGEIFTNLSTGVIDATEWVGPYHDYIMGFHKIARYYYHPGWQEPGPVLELLINKEWWAKLPQALQEIVKTAATALDIDMHSEWITQDALYLRKIRDEGQVEILSFPEKVLTELRRFADEVKKEAATANSLTKKILESQEAFAKDFLPHQWATEWELLHALKGSL